MRGGFCGWYFRCQSDSQTLAVIPAVHRSRSEQACSIQLITDGGSWNVPFPVSAFRNHGSLVEIGANRFGPRGICLDLRAPGLCAAGSLSFGPLTPIGCDIMGPFRWVPGMECRHSVFSMKHAAKHDRCRCFHVCIKNQIATRRSGCNLERRSSGMSAL